MNSPQPTVRLPLMTISYQLSSVKSEEDEQYGKEIRLEVKPVGYVKAFVRLVQKMEGIGE